MLPDDVWFHVEHISSAHVYLRLKEVFLMFKIKLKIALIFLDIYDLKKQVFIQF